MRALLTTMKKKCLTANVFSPAVHAQELLEAAKNGEMKRARLMIDDGANPSVADMGGFSALYFAALQGHPDMCQLLMKKGATFPEEGSELGTQLKLSCEYYGRTEPLALLEAAWAAAR